jgi:DNA-binding FadR family transcriptional regulator
MRIPKAAELLAERLQDDIVSGRLRSGDALPSEARLMAAVGVGRPGVREAQRILESKGLLRMARGARGGAIVTHPTFRVVARSASLWLQYHGATLRDVYDTRTVLESAAAERSAESGHSDAVAALKVVAEAEHTALSDQTRWFELGLTFHHRLIAVANLRTLSVLSEMLMEVTEAQVRRRRGEIAPLAWQERAPTVTKSHSKIARLIESGDGQRARDFWRLHMDLAGAIFFDAEADETVSDFFDAQRAAELAQESTSTPKAAELVADQLRRQIVHGTLPQDHMLPPELQLAESFNVGRPALREALRILESESLIVVERGSRGGARIRTPVASATAESLGIMLQLGRTTVGDVYETRLLYERAAVRGLAGRLAPEHHRSLRLSAEAGAALVNDPERWASHAISFHQRLVELRGLVTLSYLSGLVHVVLDRHWAARVLPPRLRPEALHPASVQRLHMKLVAALDGGDADSLEALWGGHLENIHSQIVTAGDADTPLDFMRT